MHRGYIKDYRKGIDNPLFKKPLVWHFWGYCLKRANHKNIEIDFNGKPLLLERGSFLISLNNASDETGLTIKNIRTAIKSLENHKMIEKTTKQVAKQATIINVINYGLYQGQEDQEGKASGTRVAKQGQSNGKVVAIDKNVNNENNGKKKDHSVNKPTNVSDQTWRDFLTHRKSLKAPISQTVINTFIKESEKAGMTLESSFIESISRGWRGFKAEWVNNSQQKGTKNTTVF